MTQETRDTRQLFFVADVGLVAVTEHGVKWSFSLLFSTSLLVLS